ncbi:MAG TPA: DbpA RNA binding domain-containing protein, partial [Minicystis sp.]|nr:DbpA RNA binding domain-containing protein [Minicystis sp.]
PARPLRTRPADLVSWQPPEEDNDDEPILGASDVAPTQRRAHAPAEAPPPEGDWVELYVNAGRRDGARAGDVQRALVERGGLDKAHVQRIRVRDRNAFVSVLRADVERALAALNGAQFGSRAAVAEIARGSGSADADKPQRDIDEAEDGAS